MDQIYNTNEPFTNMEIASSIFTNQTIIGEGIIDFRRIIHQVKDEEIEYLVIEK